MESPNMVLPFNTKTTNGRFTISLHEPLFVTEDYEYRIRLTQLTVNGRFMHTLQFGQLELMKNNWNEPKIIQYNQLHYR